MPGFLIGEACGNEDVCACASVSWANVVDVPFELVGEVASAGTVAEAGHIECGSAARHDCQYFKIPVSERWQCLWL